MCSPKDLQSVLSFSSLVCNLTQHVGLQSGLHIVVIMHYFKTTTSPRHCIAHYEGSA